VKYALFSLKRNHFSICYHTLAVQILEKKKTLQKQMKVINLLFLFLQFLLFPCQSSNKCLTPQDVDWKTFLSQHDMVWDKISAGYYSGAILGNGLLGTNIYAEDTIAGAYRWDIGRSDVTESREGGQALFHRARLPIGHFTLKPLYPIVSDSMRLSLYDAILQGRIETEKGNINFRTYVDAHQNIIIIETQATPKEQNYEWIWTSETAISPRSLLPQGQNAPEDYLAHPNPKPGLLEDGNYHFAVQELYSGKVYITAWHTQKTGGKCRTIVTVSFEDSKEKALTIARQTINNYLKDDKAQTEENHKTWWHHYYPAAFITFVDAKIESFYWIQQYKLACLTRSDKLIIDLMGPWTNTTPWPAIWWNLNVQLTYSPLFTANHPELSEPLWRTLNEKQATLAANVPVKEWQSDAVAIGRSSSYDLFRPLQPELAEVNQYEVGNLTWVMFYYEQYCTYKADNEELINRFYPLLKRCIAYYSHILYKGEDGKYHLPLTASPEYKAAQDCNYDLSLLRWGLKTLLDINEKHGLNDPVQTHWQEIAQNLTDYPVDSEQGYMIGRNVKLNSSHRHFSHLLMIYPLHLVHWEQEENRELILRSLNHWIGMKGALQGYSYTGSASIYAMMGKGEQAIHAINRLLNEYVQPNTLYKETGPVIETPLSAITSLQETYLQSWGGKIRIFPAVPDSWKDVSFINLRAEGGFLISGIRKNGLTVLVQIEATAGNKCIVQTNMNLKKAKISSLNKSEKPEYTIVNPEKGIIEINMRKNEVVSLSDISFPTIVPPYYTLHQETERNFFGGKRHKELTEMRKK
jgi:hypothetical protein